MEGAVAADSNNLLGHISQLGTHGCRNGISHSSHTAGGKETSFPDNVECAGPNLVLSHIRNIDTVRLHFIRDPVYQFFRIYIIRIRPAHQLHVFPVAFKRLKPILMLAIKFLFFEILKNMPCVSHQRNGGAGIFPDFSGIHIDMYQHLIMGDQIRLVHGTVGYTGPYHNQKIRFIHGPVGIGFSVVSHHAEVHGMLCGHYTDSHHCGNHRNAEFLRKLPQFLTGSAQGNAASGVNQRPFCLFQLPHYFFNLDNMPFDSGLVGPHIHLFRITEFSNLGILHIHGNINEDRTFSTCIGHIKSFFKNTGDIVHVSYEIAVFHKGLRRPCNVRFLEYIASQKLAVHLSGDTDKGNTVRKSGGNTGDQVCGPGAGGYRTYAHFSCHSGKSARRMGRILFCPD